MKCSYNFNNKEIKVYLKGIVQRNFTYNAYKKNAEAYTLILSN